MTTKTIYNTYNSLPKPKISFPKPGKKFKIFVLSVLGVLVLFAGLVSYFVILPGIKLKNQFMELKDSGGLLKDAFLEKDLDLAYTRMQETKEKLSVFETSFNKNASIASKIPFTKPYYLDGLHALSASKKTMDIGMEVLETLKPFASQLGFSKDTSSEVVDNKTRIFNLIRLMPEISSKLSASLSKISEVDKEVSFIEESRYPDKFRNVEIRPNISKAKSLLHEVSAKAPTFDKMFSLVPEILGLEKPKTYLLLMANNYELRMSGGFNTYLVLVKIDKGVPTVLMSLDTYDIDRDKSFLVYSNVPAHLRNYLLVTRFYARDATSNSPDFKVALDNFLAKFWKVDYSMPQKFDGVIQVNNNVVEDLLRVVGPVESAGYSVKTDQGTYISVPKKEFTAENVILELEKIAGGSLAETIGRKDIIRYLMLSIMDKTLNTPSENLGNLAETLFSSLNEKDIQIHFFDPKFQETVETLGYGGTLSPIPSGYDYIHVNNSNYGAGKRDWLITRELWQETLVENGVKTGVLRMKTVNPKSPTWWQWTNFYRDYFRIYLPLGAKLISASSSDGQELNAKQFDDLGKTYLEGFFKLAEDSENTISVKYQLPDTVDFNNYKIIVQKQSGEKDIPFTVTHGGNSRSFDLVTDKELGF